MPLFETSECIPFPPARVFDFFCRPASRVLLAPPELSMQLAAGPERLHRGARLTFRVRRWGLTQEIVNEVTALEEGALITEEQRDGPFERWVHSQRFEAWQGAGTRVSDAIDFEPPGGLLGLLLSALAIERDLARVYAWRREKLPAVLAQAADGGRP